MTLSFINATRRTTVLAIEVVLIAALVIVSWQAANSQLLNAQPTWVGFAIVFDLTLTTALCHWLLGVRVGGLPAWTTVPLMIAGVATSHVLLPEHVASTGIVPLVAVAIVECSALVLVLSRLRTLVRAYHEAKREGADSFDALEAGFLELAPSLPRLAAWARLEIQLWTMFLCGWLFKPRPADGPRVFTHHKTSHWFALEHRTH